MQLKYAVAQGYGVQECDARNDAMKYQGWGQKKYCINKNSDLFILKNIKQ